MKNRFFAVEFYIYIYIGQKALRKECAVTNYNLHHEFNFVEWSYTRCRSRVRPEIGAGVVAAIKVANRRF